MTNHFGQMKGDGGKLIYKYYQTNILVKEKNKIEK